MTIVIEHGSPAAGTSRLRRRPSPSPNRVTTAKLQDKDVDSPSSFRFSGRFAESGSLPRAKLHSGSQLANFRQDSHLAGKSAAYLPPHLGVVLPTPPAR